MSEVKGGETLSCYGNDVDFGKPFAAFSYAEALQRYALIPHPEKATREELALKAAQLGVTVAPTDSAEKIMDSVFKKVVRPKLIQPTYVISYPARMIPLAKQDEANPALVDAFQFYAGGMELVKAFSELNDPEEQSRRFNVEESNRKEGDKEAQPNDAEFVAALEYGMPPAGGESIGLDRSWRLVANGKNIREVIMFPTLRSKNSD